MSTSTARITVEQFDQMIANGEFESDQRIELIHGEVIEMPPPNPPHESIVDFLMVWSFDNTSREEVRVRIQNSVGLPELDSVPVPDVAWMRQENYYHRRPLPEDVLLVIEVSDSTLRKDRTTKADLYASAGLMDYWIVDVNARRILVHRNPGPDGYVDKRTYDEAHTITPLAFPSIQLLVASLFREAGG